MLSNRIVIGAVADTTFPSFQNRAGISIGGISILNSPTNGPESCSETMLSSGTVRGRIGYAPGNSLFDATGGFAWTYDQLTLTQLISGTTDKAIAAVNVSADALPDMIDSILAAGGLDTGQSVVRR